MNTDIRFTVALALGILALPPLVRADEEPTSSTTAGVESDANDGVAFQALGSFFSRYELRRNYTIDSDLVRYRARFGLETTEFRLLDGPQLKLVFLPQAAGYWHLGGDGLDHPDLSLYEGYSQLTWTGAKLQVGRFAMSYGDQLVIGTVGWHEAGRSFDGTRVLFEFASGLRLDLFTTLLREANADDQTGATRSNTDLWFLGVYSQLGELVTPGLELDVYALSRVLPGWDRADSAADATIGVRLKQELGVVDYRV
ncbi:MAG: alginate export family protein, partial [Myxococcales bacterium]|nr:alginate export family protein [Myxococcales bacterium]